MKGRALAAITLVLVGLACCTERSLPPCHATAPEGGPTIETAGDPVVLAAGDIGEQPLLGAEGTARLLDQHDGLVLALGDTALPHGTLDELLENYEPTWGRHRWRTRPAIGNHEYGTPHAGPYFAYFCAAAGEAFKGYYSFDLGGWHLVALNSACAEPIAEAPDCFAGSEQEQWLRADLAAHPSRCTLAYFHHPRFSSATGTNERVKDFWNALRDADVDVVLNGHAHVYERFAPQSPEGTYDPGGIRELVVGTGGQYHEPFAPEPYPNSEVRTAGKFGVLKLTLHATSYDWEFLTVDGTPGDKGSEPCR